jgi:hypothetical protein
LFYNLFYDVVIYIAGDFAASTTMNSLNSVTIC